MTSFNSLTSTITSSSSESISTSVVTGDREGQFGQFKLADVPKLQAIFFAKFDNVKGPIIQYQIPKEVVTKERFSSFSAAIIPKPEMYNRLIKVNFQDYKVMGHPIGLEHPDYDRHKLIFNMCFVVARESAVDCMYEPLVQKCAEYCMELEQDCRFIHREETNKKIPEIMLKIFKGLNDVGECVLPITENGAQTTMYLKLCPSYRGIEPPKIRLYMVPIFTRQHALSSAEVDKMDVLCQKIIPKIDGVRCVKEIATEVDIDPDLVSRCIRNLYFYECVSMVPLFLYSNTYVATEKVHNFYSNPKEIEECLEFVKLRSSEMLKRPLFSDVFRLYLSLRCGISLREWCNEMQPQKYNVDERRLVQFGLHHKFVRKLSVYPVATCHVPNSKIFGLCDGRNALEDLAVLYSIPPDELLELLKRSGRFEFVSK